MDFLCFLRTLTNLFYDICFKHFLSSHNLHGSEEQLQRRETVAMCENAVAETEEQDEDDDDYYDNDVEYATDEYLAG